MEFSSDHFPAGLRVLVVDDDPICLLIVERLLRSCMYQVTTCGEAVIALSMLREDRSRFDVVLSDVHMPHMDGFKLLELVRLEMDVPVITWGNVLIFKEPRETPQKWSFRVFPAPIAVGGADCVHWEMTQGKWLRESRRLQSRQLQQRATVMSANGETSNVMKGISQGACDYLLKPVRVEELRNIWQHVVRKQHQTMKEPDHRPDPKDKDDRRMRTAQTDAEITIHFTDDGNVACGFQRKRKGNLDEDSANEEEDSLVTAKRQRVVWSVELHQKFVGAINHLGLEQAVPKRILDLMNVPGLTRENVASHLQKYRLYLKKMSGSINQKLGLPASIRPLGSFMNSYAFLNEFSTSQVPDHFSQQAHVVPLQSPATAVVAYGAEGDIGTKQCVTTPLIDYKEFCMNQHLNPMLQGRSGVPISGIDTSTRQLRFVSQNTYDVLHQQNLGLPKSSTLWIEEPNNNEPVESLTGDHLFIHQLETAVDMQSVPYNSHPVLDLIER